MEDGMGTRGVKTFDELCGEVCAELRRAAKSIDLCEKMKVFQSDLKRVQVLLKYSPLVVGKFSECIGKNFEGKSHTKSMKLLTLAKSLDRNESGQAIQLLTRALGLSPWRKSTKDSQDEINEFYLTRTVDDNCVQWLVHLITKVEESQESPIEDSVSSRGNEIPTSCSSSHSHSTSWSLSHLEEGDGKKTTNHNEKEEEDEKNASPDLLANIYFERCCRLCQESSYKSAILDCVRGVICASDNGKKLTFSTVCAVANSLKALNYFNEASLVFNHALQLLRLDSSLTNQFKSKETIKIVVQLKDIKLILTSNTNTNCSNSIQNSQNDFIRSKRKQAQGQGQGQEQRRDKQEMEQVATTTLKHDDDLTMHQIYGQAHPNLIAASDAIDLKYDENRGRHVVANTTIPPGATLIVDAPYSWSLCPPYYSTLCQHCCKKVESGIPCQHCSSVLFCHWSCWQKGELYHRFECSILKYLDSSEALGEMAVLCYRTVCRTNIRVLESFVSQLKEEDENKEMTQVTLNNNSQSSRLILGLDLSSKLDPSQFSSVFAFTTNAEQRSPGDIVKRTLAAIYLTLCLRFTGYFQPSSSTDTLNDHHPHPQQQHRSNETLGLTHNNNNNNSQDDGQLSHLELQTAALILRLSQGLSCNAYGINSIIGHVHQDDSSHKTLSPAQLMGGASYPTISIINHSCNPNVFRLSAGKTCVVRSILEIQKGEELFDSYGPLFTTMPKLQRKSILKSQYFFDCDCEACENNWPLFKDLRTTQPNRVTAEPTSNYKCPGCQKNTSSSSLSKENNSNSNSNNNNTKKDKDKTKKQCSNCGQKLDHRKIAQVLAQSEKNYLAAKDSLISTGKINVEQESIFTHHISILQKFLSSPHKLIVECQETLKLAWNSSLFNSQS